MMELIEINDWKEDCYLTTRVRAYVCECGAGDDAGILECNYSKQFDTLELVSDICYKAGNQFGFDNYIYKIEIKGIDRI